MLNNFLMLIVSGLAVLYSPWWWFTLSLLLLAVLLTDNFYLILLPALGFDWLYGVGQGWLRIAIVLVVVAVPLFGAFKSRLRFA